MGTPLCDEIVAPSPIVRCPAAPTWPGEDAAIPDFGGSGQPDLTAKQRILPYFACVADLHEIIDFRPAADAVSPTVARSMAAWAWTSTSSPITAEPA